jgi:hypothetical protein
MKVQTYRVLPIGAFWNEPTIRRVAAVIALILLTTIGQITFGEKVPICDMTEDSYSVAQMSLESVDVSDWYAEAIYNDVREIIQGYLADDPTDSCFYYYPNLDDASGYIGRPLDFRCEVKRVSDDVLLSVRIYRYDTQEALISFETTAPFFQPAVAVASFAAAFPEEFTGQVVHQYSYTLPQKGFRGSWLGGLYLGDMYYPPAVFKQDLENTEEVPPEIIQSLRCYQTRNIIFGTVSLAGHATWVTAMIIGLSKQSRDVLDEETNRQLIIAFSIGALVGITASIPILLPPPRRLIANLNNWCCAE